MTFGERILKMRTKKGLTQDELAEIVGYKSRSTIAKIEAGERDVPQSMIIALSRALNTTPTYLMGWEDDEKQTNNIINSSEQFKISTHEKQLVESYRNKPDLQPVIDKLLDIKNDEKIKVYRAARSSDNEAPGYIELTQEQLDKIINAPEFKDKF